MDLSASRSFMKTGVITDEELEAKKKELLDLKISPCMVSEIQFELIRQAKRRGSKKCP